MAASKLAVAITLLCALIAAGAPRPLTATLTTPAGLQRASGGPELLLQQSSGYSTS